MLQGAASLQSLMFDVFWLSEKHPQPLLRPPSAAESFESLHSSLLTFHKNKIIIAFSSARQDVLRNKLPGNFKKGVQLV